MPADTEHQPSGESPAFSHSGYLPDRRRLLILFAGCLATPLLPISVRTLSATEAISLDAFSALSGELLGRQFVQPEMVKKLYDIFRQEPWGVDHLLRLRRKLIDSGTRPELALASLDEGERWFLNHFLTTWIAGVYYHQSGNQVISYEYALMHDSLRDIRPVPGLSDRDFGFWGQAPAGGSRVLGHG